jgi:hypothetical protein
MHSEYLSDLHENEIVFLKEDIFSSSKKWYKKACLKDAKVLLAFS